MNAHYSRNGSKKTVHSCVLAVCTMSALALFSLVPALSARAQMQSANYKIPSDSVNIGGGDSSSTNFRLGDTVGEIATGDSSSANYQMRAGFRQMDGSYLALSAAPDVTMPSILGFGSSFSEATSTWTVTTDSAAGYSLTVRASTSPALASALDSFADYPTAGTTTASDWYDEDWGYRKAITINASEVGAALTDFPVYLNLSDLGSDFFGHVRSDGGDIRITNEAGDELSREIVSIDTGSETGEVHFKADAISNAADATFYIYYGNASVSDYAEDATYGAENVWTNNYLFVSHNGGEKDSTSHGRNGTASGGIVIGIGTGHIGTGTVFDGANDYIALPNTILDGQTNITTSYWLRTSDTGAQALLSGANSSINNEYLDFFNNATTLNLYRNINSISASFPVSTIANNADRHLVTVTDMTASRIRAYLDGVSIGNKAVSMTALDIDSGGLEIGQEQDSVGGGFDTAQAFHGTLDEVRIASAARSAEWIATEYANQDDASSFYSVGAEEDSTSGSGSGTVDFNFTVGANESLFGFSPEGTDITSKFLDDGSLCGTGSLDTASSCWSGFSTSDEEVARRTSANHPSGTDTTLRLRAEVGSDRVQTAGEYRAEITVTAVAL